MEVDGDVDSISFAILYYILYRLGTEISLGSEYMAMGDGVLTSIEVERCWSCGWTCDRV